MGIHNAILNKVLSELTRGMITDISAADPTRAGIVMIGPLQGDPAPDIARISVTLFTNDPDHILGNVPTGMKRTDWHDTVFDNEVGGAITMRRRFTVKARCLFSVSRENADTSRDVADAVRDRIETLLLKTDFTGVSTDSEYVCRGIAAEDIVSELLQAGGPPDSFDYLLKIRFSVLTTKTGVTA